MYARIPLADAGDPGRSGATTFTNPRATTSLGGRTITIQAVHTSPPVPARARAWRADLRVIGDALAATPGPLVALGDYNASRDHAGFRRLLSSGRVRDAHDTRGSGLVRTWPANRSWRPPPLVHLDHVLVSDHFAVLATREPTLPGSDHHAVVADLALRTTAPG